MTTSVPRARSVKCGGGAMAPSNNEKSTFLAKLRAIKEYTPEEIDRPVIEDILEVGRWTGSGVNRQPWEVVVVEDPSVKEKFGDWGAKPAATAGVVFLIVSTSDDVAFDEGRLAERLCLAAAAHGLGSTVATLKNDGPDNAKSLLGIPSDKRAKTVVAVGHTDVEARRARPPRPDGGARKPITEFAHWERY
jgi:nitroreductase